MDRLGYECKLYYDATPLADGAVGGSWNEVTAVRDLTCNLDKDEADMTTRANAGWKATRGSLRDGSLEFDLLYDSGDAAITAIRTAYLTNALIALAAMDGDIAVAGAEGFVANFEIMSFSQPQPLTEGVTISVTAKPRDHHQWYEKAP